MSVLDSILAQAGEAPMLSSMDYSIIPSSSSVVDRKQCVSAYTVSATSVTPTDRNVTIKLGTDHFVDASSLRLSFSIVNKDASKILQPMCGPWCCWGNIRLLSQGTLIEELPMYGRHHELFGYQLLPFQEQWSEASVCGLGGSWDTATGLMYQGQPKIGKIEPGERAAVLHKLHLSLFNSGKTLPCRFMPLEVQLVLANNDEWLNTTSTFSTDFALENIRIIYDQVIADEGVVNSLFSNLRANQTLNLPCLTAYTFTHPIGNGMTQVDIPAVRAFSKISSIWVTFSNNTARSYQFPIPSTPPNGLGSMPAIDSGNPGWAPRIQLSIGGKNYPDPAPSDSISMQYYQLVRALGLSPNITRDDYLSDTYVVCFDLKKVPFDQGSGVNSRSGDLIRIAVDRLTAGRCTQAHVTFFAYTVVGVRESGVVVAN